jgi:plasmid maintenance system antidote protein VapI
MRYYSKQDLLDELKQMCAASSQRCVSESLGFRPAFINDVLRERRGITGNLASALGYVKMPDRYAKKEETN